MVIIRISLVCVRTAFDTCWRVSRPSTNRPFVEELPRLLRERGMSVRALAEHVGVSGSHLSRILNRAAYKTPGAELAGRVAVALELPVDYFPEYREGFVVERVKRDASLRDELYQRLRKHRP
jgi:transcriptional regulator with XRE-family HTH domain